MTAPNPRPSTSTRSVAPSRPDGPPRSALVRGGLVTAGAAAAVAVVVYLVASAFVDLRIPAEPGSAELTGLGLGPVLLFTMVPIAIGTAVYGVIRGRVRRHRRVWVALALGFGLLSLAPVAGIDAGAGNAIVLSGLHLSAAAAAAFVLPRAVDAAARGADRT